MNEIEQKVKYCRQYSMIYFIVSAFAVIYFAIQGTFLFMNAISTILFLVCFIGSGKKEKYGPMCGIIASIIMILTFDLLEIILAIFLLINCISLLKVL